METTRVDRTTSIQMPSKAAPVRSGTAPLRPKTDQVDLSEQAMELLHRMARQSAQEDREKSALEQLMRPWEQEDDEPWSSLKEDLEVMKECAKIAANIRSGDRVPPEDLRYLIKHDPKFYMMAMAVREPKEDPDKCDRVSKDEEQSVQESVAPSADAGAASSSPAPVSASAPEGGGSDAPPAE